MDPSQIAETDLAEVAEKLAAGSEEENTERTWTAEVEYPYGAGGHKNLQVVIGETTGRLEPRSPKEAAFYKELKRGMQVIVKQDEAGVAYVVDEPYLKTIPVSLLNQEVENRLGVLLTIQNAAEELNIDLPIEQAVTLTNGIMISLIRGQIFDFEDDTEG